MLYASEGDWKNAGISGTSMIPIIGIGATATKYGNKIDNAAVLYKGMNNLRVLKETQIKGYKVSMDLERGGSGLKNIHIKVGTEKYTFSSEAGAFLNNQGNRLPNSLRGNQQISDALKKALKMDEAGW